MLSQSRTLAPRFLDLQWASDVSEYSDLHDRTRFEHPSGDRWASLRFPVLGKPDYRVFCHTFDDGKSPRPPEQHSCAFGNLADALTFLHSFLFNPFHQTAVYS